jgi:hypothetical protein
VLPLCQTLSHLAIKFNNFSNVGVTRLMEVQTQGNIIYS